MRASAIIVKGSKVLLMHRKKEGKEYWVFPGGGIEKNETPEQAIKREVLEETCLKVIACLYSFYYLDYNKIAHPVFICKVENGNPKLGGPEAEEQSEENWYNPECIKLPEAVKLNVYPEEGIKVLRNLLLQ
jgi:8-oxo-dGTP diphosphatase